MELPIFLREHFNGMYRTDVYFISKQLAELPTFVLVPVLFVAIFYYMAGMNSNFDRFVLCCVVILLVRGRWRLLIEGPSVCLKQTMLLLFTSLKRQIMLSTL